MYPLSSAGKYFSRPNTGVDDNTDGEEEVLVTEQSGDTSLGGGGYPIMPAYIGNHTVVHPSHVRGCLKSI
jgi:hypothetical protein